MSDKTQIMIELKDKSKYFKHLGAQYQLFVAEYCTNDFDGAKARKAAGIKESAPELLAKEPIKIAVKEFIDSVLADKVSTLEAKIIDTLYKRAFYNVMMFLDQQGSPKFDINNYEQELGEWSVCIDGIKQLRSPKDPTIWVTHVQLPDRDKAIKALSAYIGLAKEDQADANSSFSVNVTVAPKRDKKPKRV